MFLRLGREARSSPFGSDLTPADVYSGRGQTALLQRERIKRKTSNTGACRVAKPQTRMTTEMGQSLR